MNTKPDDLSLALWVEDELTGAEWQAVEQWVATQPDWLARREQSRAWRATMRRALPAAEEPPYAEFFQSRIARELQAATRQDTTPTRAPRTFAWWLPLSAAAGMVLCFWAGTRVSAPTPAPVTAETPAALSSAAETNVYVPEQGVRAKVYDVQDSEGVVIVLDGVAAIPDSVEIPAQAGLVNPPAPSATAATDHQAPTRGPRP